MILYFKVIFHHHYQLVYIEGSDMQEFLVLS